MADKKKLREMIIYTCLRSEGDPRFGSVKLNKLLFFMDLQAYRSFGRTISGEEYRKLQFGPVPRSMPDIMKSMEESGEICIRKQPVWEYVEHRPFAMRKPDIRVFSRDEMWVMDDVIQRYTGVTANDISLLSHGFLGWQLAAMGEVIPFGAVFISGRALTEDERLYARELVGPAGCAMTYA